MTAPPFKVIDNNQTWAKNLSGYHRTVALTAEARAINAQKTGSPFFSFEVEVSSALAHIISVVTQVGWEFVTPVSRTNTTVLLFKARSTI